MAIALGLAGCGGSSIDLERDGGTAGGGESTGGDTGGSGTQGAGGARSDGGASGSTSSGASGSTSSGGASGSTSSGGASGSTSSGGVSGSTSSGGVSGSTSSGGASGSTSSGGASGSTSSGGASGSSGDGGVSGSIDGGGESMSDAAAGGRSPCLDGGSTLPDASPDGATPADGSSADGATSTEGGLGSESVAYQIDAAHTGWQPKDLLRLPLHLRWSHDFGAAGISYPLVAMGLVFVTVANQSTYGTQLYALDERTGAVAWGPVALGGTYFWSSATYANGRVFAVNFDGVMSAYDAATGKQLWASQMTGQYSFSSAPTAFGGRVYVGGAGSGGTVYGVDASTGNIVWTAGVENGDDSSPAVSASGVYVSYACNNAYAFSPAQGTSFWSYSGSCEGGGGKTVALIDGRVYTRDSMGDLILDASKGTLVGSYGSAYIPAGANGFLYTVNDGKVAAAQEGGASPKWTFGDGSIATAPLVVGHHVVVGTSSGELDVLSAADGSVVSSVQIGAGISSPDEQNVSSPLTGLAAANDGLYVPAGTALYAY